MEIESIVERPSDDEEQPKNILWIMSRAALVMAWFAGLAMGTLVGGFFCG